MSEVPANPEETEIAQRCPKCYSENTTRLALFYDTYECRDCRLIFDTSCSHYDFVPGAIEDLNDQDWQD